MLSDFRKFIMRGNIIDLAVGVAIGTAFTAIVASLVDDIIMPLVGVLLGGIDFTSLTLQVGDATIAYGNFIQSLISFLIIALVIFLIIRAMVSASEAMGADASELAGIVGDKKDAPAEPPPPSDEVVLLTEIRDLLLAQSTT